MLAEPPLTIDADYATNDQTGAPDGVGTRAVLVAVSDCGFHGERVAGVLAWALGARVRVGVVADSILVPADGLWLNSFMVNFSERHGYRPDRSRLHQLEEVDVRLRNAIWNFLMERFFLMKISPKKYTRR